MTTAERIAMWRAFVDDGVNMLQMSRDDVRALLDVVEAFAAWDDDDVSNEDAVAALERGRAALARLGEGK